MFLFILRHSGHSQKENIREFYRDAFRIPGSIPLIPADRYASPLARGTDHSMYMSYGHSETAMFPSSRSLMLRDDNHCEKSWRPARQCQWINTSTTRHLGVSE